MTLAPTSEELGVDDRSLELATTAQYAWFDAKTPRGIVRHERVPITTEQPPCGTFTGDLDVEIDWWWPDECPKPDGS